MSRIYSLRCTYSLFTNKQGAGIRRTIFDFRISLRLTRESYRYALIGARLLYIMLSSDFVSHVLRYAVVIEFPYANTYKILLWVVLFKCDDVDIISVSVNTHDDSLFCV